jgi:hypothetical protein
LPIAGMKANMRKPRARIDVNTDNLFIVLTFLKRHDTR